MLTFLLAELIYAHPGGIRGYSELQQNSEMDDSHRIGYQYSKCGRILRAMLRLGVYYQRTIKWDVSRETVKDLRIPY